MKAANVKAEWKGVPMPQMWRKLIAVPSSQSNYNLLKEVTRNAIQYQDTCQIKSNQINTFGNVSIQNVQYGNTWHVAVQHMHRRQSDKSNQDELNQNKWNQQYPEDANKQNDYLAIAIRNNNNNNQENENQEWTRNNQNKNKHIEVAIVLRKDANSGETVLNLRPGNQQSNDVPRLSVNGKQQQQMSESKVQNIYSNGNPRELLARVYTVKRNTLDESKVDIKVETTIGNYEVTYNGKQVQIQRNSILRGNQGICGSQTGQWYSELKSPQNKLLNNEKDFVASWALIENGQVQMVSMQAQQKARNTEYPSEETVYSNPIPNSKRAQKPQNQQQQQQQQEQQEQQNWNNSNDNEQNRNSQNRQQNNQRQQQPSNQYGSRSGTKHQTQYVEDKQKGQICFSKRPLPVCAPGTKANGKYTQTVEVYCRDINDPAAKQYKSQIQRGRNLDMSAHSSNNQMKFDVPKRCEETAL